MIDIIKTCVPIIVGALIAIIPNAIERYSTRVIETKKANLARKQELYTKLIFQLETVLNKPDSEYNRNELRNCINNISIIGSIGVVNALKKYLDSWGNAGEDQNKKYNALLREIRRDICIDKKKERRYPEIGMINIDLASHEINQTKYALPNLYNKFSSVYCIMNNFVLDEYLEKLKL
ncbi:MAG: hypothetical protein IJ195_02355 [Lachnospiraceae bacterium]|nr:hypothetical protein [Lachnospiraceae bacterium]